MNDLETQRAEDREYQRRYREKKLADPVWRAERNRKLREDPKLRAAAIVRERRYYAKNRERILDQLSVKLYGVSRKEKYTMLAAQGGCAICQEKITTSKRVHMDHDHTTGKSRGVLCSGCNCLLGYAKDDEKILARAIQYLKQWKTVVEEAA